MCERTAHARVPQSSKITRFVPLAIEAVQCAPRCLRRYVGSGNGHCRPGLRTGQWATYYLSLLVTTHCTQDEGLFKKILGDWRHLGSASNRPGWYMTVPIEHARQFGNAARAVRMSIEQIYYPNKAHGLFEPENRAGYRRQLERLLAKSLERMR